MGAPLIGTMEQICSPARMSRYRAVAADDLDAITLYLWNIQLAEALFPIVAILEVTLRNAVHNVMSYHERTPYWFPAVIHPQALARFKQNEREIARRSGTSVHIDKLISELSFGFWTSLFTKHYHHIWWDSGLNPRLADLLPNHPGMARDTRKKFAERLEYCLRLRNRMMHQEAIFEGIAVPHKSRRTLDQLHEDILELIDWINPAATNTVQCINRFPLVHDQIRKDELRNEIRNSFQIR